VIATEKMLNAQAARPRPRGKSRSRGAARK